MSINTIYEVTIPHTINYQELTIVEWEERNIVTDINIDTHAYFSNLIQRRGLQKQKKIFLSYFYHGKIANFHALNSASALEVEIKNNLFVESENLSYF